MADFQGLGIARSGLAAERDRLATTLFLAAVLHGMVIAGISFGLEGSGAGAPGLEVAPIEAGGRDEPRKDPGAYLADTSQRGSGTTRQRVAAQIAGGAPPGEGGPQERSLQQQTGSPDSGLAAVVGTTATRLTVRFVAAPVGEVDRRAPGEAVALPLAGEAHRSDTVLTGPEAGDAEWLTPDTQASIIAPYLDGWRSKVERLGTLNYPTIARRLDTRVSPVLAVEIGADGRLLQVSIQRSSGYPEVDQAAIEILKLASPFDPFPRDMARQYPRLKFAYEWRFDRGGPPQ